MKKILLLLALFPFYTFAQEPEYIGEVNLIYGNKVLKMDKEYMSSATRADAGLILFGIGSEHSKIVVPGKVATTRVPEKTEFHIIARAMDHNSDPMSVVRVFRFKTHHNSRRAEVANADVFGSSNQRFKSIKFNAVKYGKSSYDILFSFLPAGEYGVIVSNPNSRDSRSTLIYCFGVGSPKKSNNWRYYGSDGVYN